METLGIPEWVIPFAILSAIWTIPWKGFALWKAARLSHKWWFVILLVANTFALLEIIYIFFVASRYSVQTTEEQASK